MDDTYPQPNFTYLRRPVRSASLEDAKPKIRIKTWVGISFICIALFIDLFNALLNLLAVGEVISTPIAIVSTFLFTVIFWICGVSFIKKPKKFAIWAGQAIVGIIPVLNTLPELTLGVAFTVVLTWVEDGNGIIKNIEKFSGTAGKLLGTAGKTFEFLKKHESKSI